jgi:hypothetical protein
MSIVISPSSIDKVLQPWFAETEEKARELSESEKRYAVTSDRRFVFPFSHAVVTGLYSGENLDNWLVKKIKLQSCNRSIFRSYYDNPWKYIQHSPAPRPKKVPHVEETVHNVFNVAYGIGHHFHDIPNLRNDENMIQAINNEQGAHFILTLATFLNIDVQDPNQLSSQIWREYSLGIIPRLFNF